jgi:uncharacterized DUF497 family protein
MSELLFEWDTDKSAANVKKHKVSFDEAQTSFLDEDALVIEDPDDSDTEDRFILLGLSAGLRVLFVCHCVRESGSVIRIISARHANRFEQKQYTKRLRK